MNKSNRKRVLPYVLLGIVIFLILVITFLFKNQEKGQQATVPQIAVTTATILPTSGSDLSYIMVAADPDVSMKLYDAYGNKIADSSVQQPITDPVNPENKNNSVTQLYIEKLRTGNYRLIILSKTNKVSKISTYFYDINGDVSIAQSVAVAGSSSFILFFDKNDNKKSYIKQVGQN